MILAPGTFKVSEHRKPITAATERAVLKRYRRDHRPALCDRPFDTEANDFIPPQNDPDFIFLVEIAEHDRRTFGRTPGAAKTVTTRGSDVGERKRSRDIRTSEAVHRAAVASRSGDYKGAAAILASAPKKPKTKKAWPSRPMQSRGFR
jgi:hypothetical protein